MNFIQVLYVRMLFTLLAALARLVTMLARPARFFVNAGSITKAIMEAVVLVVVVIMLDIYVIGNDAIINSETTIGAAVVPILQAVLLIVAILGAIGLLYYAAKNSLGGK
jgi:hypothetical protein